MATSSCGGRTSRQGLKSGGFGVVDGGLEDLLVVFVGGDTAKVEPDALDFVGLLGRADQLEQTLARVEGSVRVVITKGRAVVRPLVPDFAQFDRDTIRRPDPARP